MKIRRVILSPGLTGFYFDDQRAIKKDAEADGFSYRGEPVTAGFSSIRQKGESISIQLLLEDGQVAYGDCAAVQYSGAGGRDPLFLAEDYIPVLEEEVVPLLAGLDLSDKNFRQLAEEFDGLRVGGHKLHTAIRYGLTQALLDAVARARKKTMVEVIQEEYGLSEEVKRVPVFAQTGDDRHLNADKIIIKGAQVLPHGLINNVREKLGVEGERLVSYISWLRNRVSQIGAEGYRPVLHIDVYGTIGLIFSDPARMVEYFKRLEEAAKPLHLRIEGPVDMEEKEAQIAALRQLTADLQNAGVDVEIVADEWCNTLEDIKDFVDARACSMVQIKTPDLGGINNCIEAVLYCKDKGIGAYLGGTCNETDRSARICTHIALATQPDQMLAKPGMGVDEGLMIVTNEMNRALAMLEARNAAKRRYV
ncbi:MAG: methylaspartate ammonia-lyase [Halanaerobium sp.]|nr:methylaspartate ammonia-lyase [Halanaerobium sp.]